MLFDPNVRPLCAYCQKGVAMEGGNDVLCPHKGIVSFNFSCRRFIYDPFKRIKKRPAPVLQKFEEKDFTFKKPRSKGSGFLLLFRKRLHYF